MSNARSPAGRTSHIAAKPGSANESAAKVGQGFGGSVRHLGVIRALAVDDLLREPEFEMTADPVDELASVAAVPDVLDGASDGRRIPADLAANVVKLATLRPGRFRT